MRRYMLSLSLFFLLFPVVRTFAADEVSEALSRAESLYYEAKFRDAIQLLQHADELLRADGGRVPEKINVKIQLALSYVGLNQVPQAKNSLRDVFVIDADYKLDPQQFPPKIMALADEAKAEQGQVRCQQARADARKYLDTGNAALLLTVFQTMKPKCTGLDAMEPEAAELFFKKGLELFKAGQYPDALQKFQTALKLSPKHELATQYLDLTQTKLQVNADRLVLEWRKTLESRQFQQAAARYVQLKTPNSGATPQMLDQMRSEYRNALTSLVDSANKACASGDTAASESLRAEIPGSLPLPELGNDVLAQLKPCVGKKGCMPMATQLALARLKVQVNPVIPPSLQDVARRSQISVQVKTKIDEKGNVTALSAQGSNPILTEAVRTAVSQWKFTPIIDASGPRCVETDITVTLKP
jgi:tetratricopeptide (TPR) repeat protein